MLPARRLFNDLPSSALALVCAGLGVAWVIEPALAPVSWGTRLAILLAGCTLAAAAGRILGQRQSQDDKSAQRYLDLLSRLDVHQLAASGEADGFPALSPGNPWQQAFTNLRASLSRYASKLEEAELARAGADVRARRTTSERDQLHDILAGLSDPVLAIGPYGEILHANEAAERLLALNTAVGASAVTAPLARFPEVNNLLGEVRRRKTASQRTAELLLTLADGRQQWYRVHCRTLVQSGDIAGGERAALHGAVAVFTDITAHKAIQQRNAEFVSAASHEMKTPLSSIRAYIELLADGEAEDEQTREEFFGVIHTQAERLQRLIDNLLNLARIEAGVVNVNKEPRSLNELLQEAVNVVQPTAEQKHITLTTDFSPLYLGVLADRDTLLQAAINLMSNAIKYTPDNGQVSVVSRLNDQEVSFEVVDSGVGLSEEDCQKVFEKFYRVKKDQQMAPGTGLGLPLVKHIVEDIHAGRIEVESELGTGSTFRIVLPGLAQLSA